MIRMLSPVLALVLLSPGCSSDDAALTTPIDESSKRPETRLPIAYGRFVPEREDDFAWENDKVAFRVFGPGSSGVGQVSGVDAFLKRVEYPTLDKWYSDYLQGISYHEDRGEGYDPFHTGDSRGVGGTAIWLNGDAYSAATFDSYEVIESGADVVRFVLEYQWDSPLGEVAERKTVTLRLGDQLYSVDSLFTLNGEPAALPVAIGLTTHDGAAEAFSNAATGRISTWESIDGLGLGLGAVIDAAKVMDIVTVDSEDADRSHIWLLTQSDADGRLAFKAGYAWEAKGNIQTIDQWNEYLDSRLQ